LVFPVQKEHVHGSNIIELPNRDLLVVWFQGSGERNADDVRIMGARKGKSAVQWSQPFEMADTKGLPDCNPVLFLNQDSQLFLFWITVPANRWENSIIRYRISSDFLEDGPPVWNWQEDLFIKPGDTFAIEILEKWENLPPSAHGWAEYARPYDEQIKTASQDLRKRSFGWMTRCTPLVLKNGRILLPLYSDGFNLSLMAISDDDGNTWRPGLPIVGRGPIQPAIIQKQNGDIVAFMRDSGDEPSRIQISISSDNGISWSAAQESQLPNTASVQILTLNDNNWLMVGNHIENGRYKLSGLWSHDEGENWVESFILEHDANEKNRYSYPGILQSSDGSIHITYSVHLATGKKTIKEVILGYH